MRRLEFGWFLPTAGDTTAYGLASAQVAPSLDLFDRVVQSAEAAGIAFVGPTSEQIRKFGLKHTARGLAKAAGVPLLPGSPISHNQSPEVS